MDSLLDLKKQWVLFVGVASFAVGLGGGPLYSEEHPARQLEFGSSQEGPIGLMAKRYGIECIADVEDPVVLTAPDVTKNLEHDLHYDPGFFLFIDQIIFDEDAGPDGVQFLSGYLFNQAGRGLATNVSRNETDHYRLYVLSREWSCVMSRGDQQMQR